MGSVPYGEVKENRWTIGDIDLSITKISFDQIGEHACQRNVFESTGEGMFWAENGVAALAVRWANLRSADFPVLERRKCNVQPWTPLTTSETYPNKSRRSESDRKI